jgi:hypothetical protein
VRPIASFLPKTVGKKRLSGLSSTAFNACR